MKKLVLGLALLLTSENITRGLPIYTRTSWKNFSSYDLLLNIKEEKLIQKRVSNTDYKFNFNLQIISINKKLKIYLDFSAGLAFRSFPGTNNQIIESYDALFEKKKKKNSFLPKGNQISIGEVGENNDKQPIFITSVESCEKKNFYNIHYMCNDSLKCVQKDIRILFAGINNNNNPVYPCSLKGLFIPISGGLSAKIKIQSKTYIKIYLHGYININLYYYYDFTHLINLMGKYMEITNEELRQNVGNYCRVRIFDEEVKEIAEFFDSFPLIKPFSQLMLSSAFNAIDNDYSFNCFYGGIFNITISWKIYKHLEIGFSFFSLEYFLVNDYISKEKCKLKTQFKEFENRKHVLFLHLPSFEISII